MARTDNDLLSSILGSNFKNNSEQAGMEQETKPESVLYKNRYFNNYQVKRREGAKETITQSWPVGMRDWLKLYAIKHGYTMSGLVQDALREFIESRGDTFDF